ncbi:hypothetical protein UAY_00984 [Enterococcus moraviensis ATCC BAA-383]|uniref:Helicase n=1 Tax=Enterococcus moraviensis ATCC BAA-383 TaxID=1158609 RepID=R2TRB4_9ENTE|nr:DEAD/DEAH box helicase [Enterococcus moraviensis]EOI02737.1 hypothetical protein UAY_00984 [Enterococcus moraviensis ATCC BAA-383]EOT73886.1 hypothetical protein I586_00882 [Enterococcus moraviensis ATCC BAA-383]
MTKLEEDFQAALRHSFIKQTENNNDLYKARLLVNNDVESKFVLNELKDELSTCQEFFFAVAFITESGLASLKTMFADLKRKNIRGRIITSDYLYFNSPKMFRELLKLSNVEIRIINISGFHAKGYYFAHEEHETMILGSSNLTIKALKVNCEWNLKLNSLANGELIQDVKKNFENMWTSSKTLTSSWIESYILRYKPLINTKKIDTSETAIVDLDLNLLKDESENLNYDINIEPNKMQEKALKAIQKIRDEAKNKALVVSATGTGKTYLSAFDVKNFKPKRILFVVHQELILVKAMSDYHKIVGGDYEKDYGILSKGHSITKQKYVFATIQSLSKDKNLELFSKEEFDYILIDEVHKAGAESYLKVINYFEPKFLLGMTATPERTDGFNIYELFDYNLAYEIRLQEALKEDMLCPFHYFGITDLEINGNYKEDKSKFDRLIPEERVEYIFEQIDYYGYSGDTVKGLIFCGRKDEAYELEKLFNDKGFKVKALTSEHNITEREKVIDQLISGALDYIITVDIFNEGVDIPPVNQVIMLRKTKSSIIFTQQLGRGLRKATNKEFVTIIDFIGNYDNNYLIPIALTEDQSLSKNDLRKKTMRTQYLSGVSTINFDEIAKKKIFDSIESSKMTMCKNFKEEYLKLKNKIGRIPKLIDYLTYHSFDPTMITTSLKKINNYPEFLDYVKEPHPILSIREGQILTFLMTEFLNGKRNHEILLLLNVIKKGKMKISDYIKLIKENEYPISDSALVTIERIFNMEYFTEQERTKYGKTPILNLDNNIYKLSKEFSDCLSQNTYFSEQVKDIIDASLERSKRYNLNEQLTYNEIYTRKDVCRLLNWKNNESGSMFGYSIKENTCPIFVNYHKDEDSLNYADEFINRHSLIWSSKKQRTKESKDVKQILKYKKTGLDIHIFVQKETKKQVSEYIYLGKAFPKVETARNDILKGSDEKVVTMEMLLENAVPLDTYDFITQK